MISITQKRISKQRIVFSAFLFAACLSVGPQGYTGEEGDLKSEPDSASTQKQFVEAENPQEESLLGSLSEEVLHRITEFCSRDRLAYGASMRVCQKLYRVSQEKKFRLNAIASQFADKEKALLDASFRGNLEKVEALLIVGVDPNVTNKDFGRFGETPLHLASRMGHAKVVELLLKHGANPNARGVDLLGRPISPPLVCVLEDYQATVQVVELLLRYGADPNTTGRKGYTPLHFAADRGYFGVAQLLVKYQADARAVTEYGWTALEIAELKGLQKTAEMIKNYLSLK
jgi:ankyrin repeat protein